MQKVKQTKRLLSVEAAAELLGISTWTVRDMMARGELPYVQLRKRKLVDILDAEALILQNKVKEG